MSQTHEAELVEGSVAAALTLAAIAADHALSR
jgi:hypothetical protein